MYDSLVMNNNGKSYLRCVNTSFADAIFSMPTMELEEIEDVSTVPKSTVFRISTEYTQSTVSAVSTESTESAKSTVSAAALEAEFQARYSKILDIISTEHMNGEELEHAKELIRNHHDLFHLSGDKLGKTGVVKHKIPTSNQAPIHVKQYRYPTIHRDKINK